MDAKVYFVKASAQNGDKIISQKTRKLFRAGHFENCFRENDITAIKVHVGEAGNNTHISPLYIKGLVDELLRVKTKPFLTDTSTLYTGQRRNAIDHHIVAAEHGFSLNGLGIPFIVSDGLLGTSDVSVRIDGQINKDVFIAYDVTRCQSILSVAHVTGHMATCFGATIKTLGMGCASKKGKMKQHAALKLAIGDNCTRCGLCVRYCPADAITLDEVKANIDQDKCIGCAECLAICRFNAVKCNWGEECEVLQKSMAEHALGVLKGKENRAAFFNFVMSVTKDCDCFDTPNMPKIVDDIGVLASTDPVAVDQAAIDLIEDRTGKKLPELVGNNKLDPRYQIEHAERIGLGTKKYRIVEIE